MEELEPRVELVSADLIVLFKYHGILLWFLQRSSSRRGILMSEIDLSLYRWVSILRRGWSDKFELLSWLVNGSWKLTVPCDMTALYSLRYSFSGTFKALGPVP